MNFMFYLFGIFVGLAAGFMMWEIGETNNHERIRVPEHEQVLAACEGVCMNSDAYDADMIIVRSCDQILKYYDMGGCFAE